MASLRVVSETWLRKHLAPSRLKNLQALFTLVGIVLLFLLFALARSQVVIQWVVRLARAARRLLVWNPLSIPAAAFSSARRHAAWEIAAPPSSSSAAIGLCSFLVRDGLVSAPAVYSGDRGSAPMPRFSARRHHRQGPAAAAARPQFLRPDPRRARLDRLLPDRLQRRHGPLHRLEFPSTPPPSPSPSARTS